MLPNKVCYQIARFVAYYKDSLITAFDEVLKARHDTLC